MPSVLRSGPYRFYFYSHDARREGERRRSRRCGSHARGWEGRADARMRSRSGWLRRVFLLMDGYAAADFLAVFGCALMGGLGATFFAVFAFSLAANSCLTVAVIAATSTL